MILAPRPARTVSLSPPSPVRMMDRVECSGVYIDDRVRSERWVRRNSIEAATISSAGSFSLPEEPEALQADVEQLMDVCKKS